MQLCPRKSQRFSLEIQGQSQFCDRFFTCISIKSKIKEFIYDSHGQTFLSTLYIYSVEIIRSERKKETCISGYKEHEEARSRKAIKPNLFTVRSFVRFRTRLVSCRPLPRETDGRSRNGVLSQPSRERDTCSSVAPCRSHLPRRIHAREAETNPPAVKDRVNSPDPFSRI